MGRQPVDRQCQAGYFPRVATLEQVIEHFGGSHESLAKQLGLKSRTAVTMWRGKIPRLRAFQIEVLSKGKFKFSDLPVRRAQKRAA